jgi:hypothetical protein
MSTFRPNGTLRNNDDTQLWKEILEKERYATKMHQDYLQTDHFASTHATRFGEGRLNVPNGHNDQMKNILNNDLSKT